MGENKITFEDIQKANETIKTIAIERKDKDGKKTIKLYSEVNQRIKAFRMICPDGTIKTEIEKLNDGICVMRAYVYDRDMLLGTGTAYEVENSSFINKTSYIENCETSAVGRALAMCGIGIDTSIASAEEVTNKVEAQDNIDSDIKEIKTHDSLEHILDKLIKDKNIDYDKMLELYKVEDLHLMTIKQMQNAIANIDKLEKVSE